MDNDTDTSRPTMRFFSLKWRALLLTSSVLLLMTMGSAWVSYQNLIEQLREQRSEAGAARLREVHALMGQSFERLRQLAAMVPSIPGVQSALPARDARRLGQVLDSQWPALQLDLGIDLIAFYGPDGGFLQAWDVETGRLPPHARFGELIVRARETEAPAYLLDCDPECVQYLAAPVLAGGRSVGVVVLGANLADLVRNFAAVSGTDIGLLRMGPPRARTAELGRLSDWNADVSALTRPLESLPVLRRAAALHTLDEAADGVLVESGQQACEVRVSALPGVEVTHPVRLVVVSDIGDALAAIRDAARESATASAIGWGLAELLLLGSLWAPMSRLRVTARTLPLLATGAFGAVRRAIRPRAERPLRPADEIDILDSTTVALADRLEELEGQVAERTQTLSRRMDELAAERDFVASLLDTAQVAILTLDQDGQILRANPFTQSLTGQRPQDLLGRRFTDLLLPEAAGDGAQRLAEVIAVGQRHLRHESLVLNRDGSLRNVTWYHSRLRPGAAGGPVVLSVGLDNTERRGAESRLAWMADHDTLTGLPNRRRFQEELELMLNAAQRQGRVGALLLLDLDQFKYVNEADSHLSGDRLLKTIGSALAKELMLAELVARLGGDEFGVLVRDVDAEGAARVAAEINAIVSGVNCEVDGRTHRITASIGVALFPEHGQTVEELLANADLAMYQAKEAGRGHWHVFSEADRSREQLQNRVYWKDRVAQALAEDRFVLYFQPIMHIADGTIAHYEVLLRLLEDDGTVFAAGQFIDAAERTGMIHAVDRVVLSKAIHFLADINRRGIDVSFSLNLSGHSLNDADLLAHLQRELEASGVDTSRLIFEITETAAVGDFAQATSMILFIKSLGCRFALDDFGIGFSSFSYLKHFPVDYLKIDGSFIRQLAGSPDDQIIVKALNQIAAGFGKHTVAEYVESADTLALLREFGIDYAQGYYVSEPRSAEELFGLPLVPRSALAVGENQASA
ncbi:diguanylate cyclase/phosphodiesterase [Plasticicumulans lactativorans]|uniref:Diguanylate cyclase/phosphodiesterase n=1 Tax=Plasticicumulans lactativorans TaxID=1133106 RepID=A0A4R2LD35_9GAMM|nr:EAL domain-containing protein [Plasticicumulans lactativorans]TCO82346.1 diguanylate cyclase/phosphodiesterase [Plasticicumulans lactativorans]